MGFVHPSVKIGQGVVIGSEVIIEAGCSIGHYSIVEGATHIGPDNKIGHHVVLGGEPQDLKFKGGGRLTIGRGNTFREFCTVHVGHLTEEGTLLGDDNMFLTGAHVGHDCRVGSRNFLANQLLLAGHVEIGDDVNISGHVGAHQFCRIGSHVMISGMSAIRRDVPPYAMVQGDPAKVIGINRVGMSRKGFDGATLTAIREAYRCFRNQIPLEGNPFFDELCRFKENSDRGLTPMKSKA